MQVNLLLSPMLGQSGKNRLEYICTSRKELKKLKLHNTLSCQLNKFRNWFNSFTNLERPAFLLLRIQQIKNF